MGVGKIYKDKEGLVRHRVQSIKELFRIIEHLAKYPLITEKQADY